MERISLKNILLLFIIFFYNMDKPIIIKGEEYYFSGYIFLDDNWILVVKVDAMPRNIVSLGRKDRIPPFFYISTITMAMKYNVIDEKIIVDNEILAYLENTYLYIDSFNDELEDSYRKYRLESKFSIFW